MPIERKNNKREVFYLNNFTEVSSVAYDFARLLYCFFK